MLVLVCGGPFCLRVSLRLFSFDQTLSEEVQVVQIVKYNISSSVEFHQQARMSTLRLSLPLRHD